MVERLHRSTSRPFFVYTCLRSVRVRDSAADSARRLCRFRRAGLPTEEMGELAADDERIAPGEDVAQAIADVTSDLEERGAFTTSALLRDRDLGKPDQSGYVARRDSALGVFGARWFLRHAMDSHAAADFEPDGSKVCCPVLLLPAIAAPLDGAFRHPERDGRFLDGDEPPQ